MGSQSSPVRTEPDPVAIGNGIAELLEIRRELERANRRLPGLVAELRRSGASWSVIGTALGLSKQSVYQRFGRGR